MKKLLLGFALSTWVCLPALADDNYFFVIEKSREKTKTRWSLQSWLEQRDRIRLMDLWLAYHAPSPYEFFLTGRYLGGSTKTGAAYAAWELAFSAYAYYWGLEFSREFSNREARHLGTFNLRIFGRHQQSTNITLQGGLRHDKRGGQVFLVPVAGASLNFYFVRAFGIEGVYRYQFSKTVNGVSLGGQRIEASAFLDFAFVRTWAGYFTEPETGTAAISPSGFFGGLKIYF